MLTIGPNLGLIDSGSYGEDHYSELLRFFRSIDLLVQPHVKSATTTTPPTTPADGDAYIIPDGATGEWAGNSGKLARWTAKLPKPTPWVDAPAAQWEFISPKLNWRFAVDDAATAGQVYRYTGATWEPDATTAPGGYVLPVATASVLGGIKAGTGLTISGSGVADVTLPTASDTVLGGVKVGSGLTIDVNGVLSTSYSLPVANGSTLGGVKIGANVTVAGDGTISVAAPYSLPTASASVLGGIKVGANLAIDGNGVLSANPGGYTLPIASDTILGGIKVGANLSIDGSGVLSANPGGYTLPAATASTLGGVKQGNNVTIAGDGTISVANPYVLPTASAGTLGGVKVGSGLAIDGNGVLSATGGYTLPVATASVLGGVKQGSNVTIAGDGTISVAAPYTLPVATDTVLGGVKQGSNVTIAGDGTLTVSAGVFETAGAVAAHLAAGDPHPQYLTPLEADAAYALIGHDHTGTYALISHNHDGVYFPVAGTNGTPTQLNRYTGGSNNPGLYVLMNEAGNVASLYSNTTLGLGGQSTSNTLEITTNAVTVNGTLTADGIVVNTRARNVPLTDNDLSFDLSARNNFSCTPTAGGALTFTNIAAGQSGFIFLVNNSNYAISLAAGVDMSSSAQSRISATGTYLLSYYCNDGSNVRVVASEDLSS